MKKSAILIFIFLLTFISINLAVQHVFDKGKMNAHLGQSEKNNSAMLGVAITKDGKIVYKNYIGLLSEKDNLRSSNATGFRIDCITKKYMATLIFELIEEGKPTEGTKLAE